MNRTVTLAAGLLLTLAATAGDVYVTRDAKGNLVYTDIPTTLPAEKVGIRSTSTDPAEVQKRYDSQMQQYEQDDAAKSKPVDANQPPALTPEERAKRCGDARQRHQAYLDAFRLFEELPNGERRYLTNEQIDAARAEAKADVERSCSDQ
jgi:hypothetical protein